MHHDADPPGPAASADTTGSGAPPLGGGVNTGDFDESPKYGPTHHENAMKLTNPLAGLSKEDVLRDVDVFVKEKGLDEHRDDLRKGALLARVAQDPEGFERIDELTEEEKLVLRREITHRWSQPFQLYFLCILCAGSAIVQGMDQTAVNGAQSYYFAEFGIGPEQVYIRGLLNGIPYLAAATIGCWTNAPLNKYLGRRGTIFICCFISFATSFWMAASPTWGSLLASRAVLGLAIGGKSSTTPVYSSEAAPKAIRGALGCQWQMWTAFGIMLGFVASVAFQDTNVPVGPPDGYSNWRWMLGSTAIPPMIVMAQVYFCPESPRWYMSKNRYPNAYRSFLRLRNSPVQAARDLYYAHKSIEVEQVEREGKSIAHEWIYNRRVRRAAQSSFFVMFMQQFCGVNVIAYYSTQIFVNAGFDQSAALLISMGTGIVNWLFAIPAVYTIDTFGRRNLLLFGFPTMGLALYFTGFSFFMPELNSAGETNQARVGMIAAGIFVFMALYSPSEGPVPFTYSSEAFPLYTRDTGMAFATSTCWLFNFILSFTWPALEASFTSTGAFAYYATWNMLAMVYTYFLLPETKNLTLEELDTVFSIGNRGHAKYYWHKLPWYLRKYFLRRTVEDYPPLYQIYSTGEDALEKPQEKQRI
ncbi:transporter-domain-containing protein [Dioszegia hungarica]|uniref:Transporter-domain-containing protein n=1 Tax=Dioszegia hungarica TaxID=4972 RepID=A0AA38H2L1_9TREE|nr:transporter-domain-containing protein [Dioszegia hungarica]KAI9633512.1 transporter-domain-containing protein [Dioszegia hungarica]